MSRPTRMTGTGKVPSLMARYPGGAVDAELGEGFVGGDAGACGGVGDHGVLRLSSCGSM